LRRGDLSLWDINTKDWKLEKEILNVMIGASDAYIK
tara:strand:+ start:6526 stop:6633 length:108 start_codon:yes stop_codon:yes gene_type:complete